MAILSVGIVGAMQVFPVGLRASQRSELNSRATLAAQRVIESLKLKTWDQLPDGETTDQDGEFTITTRITSSPVAHLADPTRLKRVQVLVHWSQAGQPRQLAFITYVRREAGTSSEATQPADG